MQFRWKHWSRSVQAACEFTDGECEIKESVQVMDTEARKVFAVRLVCDSVRNRMAGQCSGVEGCLDASLIESKVVLDVSKVKLRDPESILRELKIRWMFVGSQAVYEFDMSFALATMTLFSGLGTDVQFPGDGSIMQWSTSSSCSVPFGLVTSRIVTVTLFDGACERTATRDQWNKMCNCSPSVLCKDSSAISNFVKRSLSGSVRTMTEMIQRQKDAVFTSGE